jgi:dolichyl-diphosphooligosaccharide--protein glycosyltransferase
VTAFPAPVRRGLVLAAAALAVWIRVLPLALDGVETRAGALAHDAVRQRIVAADGEAPGPDLDQRVAAWIDANPAAFARDRRMAAARLRAERRYRGGDGRVHPYLADYDSYYWLRQARTVLRTGTPCDEIVAGECRDTYANAPVGGPMRYARSLHVAAIVGLHRVLTLLSPGYPLPATAFWVPVIVGTLGVFPAFGIGRRLAGDLAGFFAAVVATANPLVLTRSVGADNDVWNVVLPLYLVWAAMGALGARRARAQIAWALLAGGVAGLHAAVWDGWVFTYAIVLSGLVGAVLVAIARAALGVRDGPGCAAAARSLIAFYVAAGLAIAIAAPGESYLTIPARMLAELTASWAPPLPPPPGPSPWASALDAVAELERPERSEITVLMGGPLYLFAGWLGLLVMLLPRRAWAWWHFILLIGGNYLYLHLVSGAEVGRGRLVVLLALPLVTAVLAEVVADRHRGDDVDPTRGGRLIVALWLVVALFQAYGAARWVLLLAAPFGLGVAVAAGRLHGWLIRGAARLPGGLAAVARLAVPVVLALGLVQPVQRAHGIMRAALPEIDDAWWNALTRIREETPSEALVITWWDYGHWAKYVAERRTSADGSTLRTHVAHWLARALLAPSEREAVGILRMLSCGSDATPEREGRRGALGKLRARGLDQPDAYRLVADLVRRDRAGAEALLAARGLAPAARADILASTHCTPPPAYLVLDTELTGKGGWLAIARWRPFEETGSAVAAAQPFLRSDWIDCRALGSDDALACPLEGLAGDALAAAFNYRVAVPADGRIVLQRRGADGAFEAADEWRPRFVVVAGSAAVETVRRDDGNAEIAAVVDVPSRRVLLGAPDVMRSTFVRLAFLDGRATRHFTRFDERLALDGTRVVTFQVRW